MLRTSLEDLACSCHIERRGNVNGLKLSNRTIPLGATNLDRKPMLGFGDIRLSLNCDRSEQMELPYLCVF